MTPTPAASEQEQQEWKRIIYICEKNADEWRGVGNVDEGEEWSEMAELIRRALSLHAQPQDARKP